MKGFVGISRQGEITMAPRRRDPGKGARDRVDFRVEPALAARIEAAAARFGISVVSYIKLAISERLERDEATRPPRTRGKG
jgi:predicted HicB family RNase H-like nuclease